MPRASTEPTVGAAPESLRRTRSGTARELAAKGVSGRPQRAGLHWFTGRWNRVRLHCRSAALFCASCGLAAGALSASPLDAQDAGTDPPLGGRPGDPAAGGSGGASGGGGGAGGRPPAGAEPAGESGPSTLEPGTARRLEAELDDAAWFGWWEREQDAYLTRLRPAWHTLDGDASGRMGGGTRVAPEQLVPELSVQRSIIPALFAYLEKEPGPEGVEATLVALARLPADEAQSRRVRAMLERAISEERTSTAGVAALALGVQGSLDSAPLLLDLATDGALGRRAMGGRVPDSVRVAAALGAGILGERAHNVDVATWVTQRLVALAVDSRSPGGVRLAALIGAGAAAVRTDAGLHSRQKRDEWTVLLQGLLEGREEQQLLRARAAVALARVARTSELPERKRVLGVLRRFAEERQPEAVRRGALSAIVVLGTSDPSLVDRGLLQALTRAASSGPLETRGPTWIGLARLGAASLDSDYAGAARAALLERLGRASGPERGWCALALGVLGVERAERGAAPDLALRAGLLAALERERASGPRGALALACALSGAVPSAELLEGWSAEGEERTRAWSTFALGATLGPAALAQLVERLDASRHAPVSLPVVASALALQGAGTAQLRRLVREDCCLPTTVAAVRAMGESGDERARTVLLELLQDPGAQSSARAAAAAAIGRLGDRRPERLGASLGAGVDQVMGLELLYDNAGRGALQLR